MTSKRKIETIALPVEGMTCASCVRRVEKTISKFEGVSNVSVNLATERATFSYDIDSVNLEEIARAVEDAGYKLHLPEKTKNKQDILHQNSYENEIKKDLIISAVFSIPIFL